MKTRLGIGLMGLFCCPLLAATPATPQDDMVFPLPGSGRPIHVFVSVPENFTAQTPVVFVLTGIKRNAADYRDAWRENARKNNLLVLVPEFPRQDYPGVNGYNLGNLINPSTGRVNPRNQWSFNVIDTLFEQLRKQGITRRPTYYLFGNSAGCQFVHRMLTVLPAAKVKAAICAAAGWWTLPDDRTPWPYGLAQAPVPVETAGLGRYFAVPLLVAVGQNDNNPNHPLLRRTPQVMPQGDNRLVRAQNYYLAAQRQSRRNGLPFHWQFTVAPGIGHSGSRMSAWAALQFAHYERTGAFAPPAKP